MSDVCSPTTTAKNPFTGRSLLNKEPEITGEPRQGKLSPPLQQLGGEVTGSCFFSFRGQRLRPTLLPVLLLSCQQEKKAIHSGWAESSKTGRWGEALSCAIYQPCNSHSRTPSLTQPTNSTAPAQKAGQEWWIHAGAALGITQGLNQVPLTVRVDLGGSVTPWLKCLWAMFED